ncbi:MAG: phage head-tail connector protein [Holophagales bacterium]|jgi:hypothetical protein|nr:phage head-tail connector protein [Holophagales bacterium]
MPTWIPKPAESTEYFSLDLARQLSQDDSIAAAQCAIEAINGTDFGAADMLVGDVAIDGTIVTQAVKGGTYGCRYQLIFTIETALGETLTLDGDFLVGNTEQGSRDLTTLQAVKDWLSLKNDVDNAMLQRLITSESMAIERYLGRPVLPETRTDTITGYGTITIVAPASPIQSIEKVLVDGAEVQTNHDRMAVWRADNRPWPQKARIQLTYTAGYDSIPSDIEQACIELVALRFKERDRIGQTSANVAGETVSYITRAMPLSTETRLAPYRKVAPC